MAEALPVWRQPVMGETLPRAALSLPGLEALGLFSDKKVLPPPLGCANHTTLPAGVGCTTTELALGLVRPVPTSGTLTATARVIYSGHSTALADARDTGYPEHAPFRQPVRGEVLSDEIWESRSGLDVLRAQVTGELPPPPIGELLGMRALAASEGAATFALPAHAWLGQPLGFVQGGVTGCLADSAMSSAVQTTFADGRAFAPVDLRVNFLRPVRPDNRELTATASIVHRGRSMAYSRADVVNEDGKIVAMATSTTLYR